MSGNYFARQPILDRNQALYAYELLYRGDFKRNEAGVIDGDAATTEVMFSALVDTGLQEVVGNSLALINITGSFLQGDLALPEEKDQIILEILEDIEPTTDIVEAILGLAEQGYRLALDDYQHRHEFEPLLNAVELVKLDVRALTREELEQHVQLLRQFDCELLAEKVETRAEYEFCHGLGFDYFQGYFFCEPERLTARRSGVNHTTALRLMARLQDEACSFDEIQSLIGNDAALSVRLLRFVNSPFCGVPREVRSLRDALSLVGLNIVRRWATLLLMTRLGEGKSDELINLALIRGKMCEQLGESSTEYDASEYFTVGLFSIMDALFDQPMEIAVDSLPLSQDLKDAIEHRTGELGETLASVVVFERDPTNSDSDEVAKVYLDSVRWARQISELA